MDVQDTTARKRHGLLWIVSVIIAFLLGYLLAHRLAPSCLQTGMLGKGGGGMMGGGGAGAAAPAQGAPAGGGTGDGAPPPANGLGEPAPSGGGPLDGGGAGGTGKMDADLGGGGGGGDSMQIKRAAPGDTAGNGTGDDGPGSGRKHPDGAAPDFGSVAGKNPVDDVEGTARSMAGGQLGLAANMSDAPSRDATAKTQSAPDFRFDRTMLPRYQGTIAKVGSALVTDSAKRTDSSSVVAVSTSDGFDAAVAWYRSHLPASWPEQTIGDVDQLAKQLSAKQIMQTLQQLQASGSATPALPATAAADRRQVAIFAPPDSANNYRGVMIVQQGSKPTTIVMKRKVSS